MNRLVSCRREFTLLEMVVALGILAMIGAAFMVALAAGTKSTGTLDAVVDAPSFT